MPFEIDMLSVGNADAIILRYLDAREQEYVVLIDAGNEGDGPLIKEHIEKYTSKKSIDLAICTHPDDDHIGGFPYVVEHIPIDQFWIHDPSKHLLRATEMFESYGDYFEKSLKNLYESLTDATNLLQLIDDAGIDRSIQPFTGTSAIDFGIPLTIVGPTEEFYRKQLDGFRGIEQLYESITRQSITKQEIGMQINEINKGLTLNPINDYSKENNSSVILLFEPGDGKYLFTADAGPKALKRAMRYTDLSELKWLKVPHHGSSYNLTDTLMDDFSPKTAYISCCRDKHYPDPAIVEYLKDKGCAVYSTCDGRGLRHFNGIPSRAGFSKATSL